MNNKGQSIVEYLVMTVAVVVVIIAFLSPLGPFRKSFDRTLDMSFNQIEEMAANASF